MIFLLLLILIGFLIAKHKLTYQKLVFIAAMLFWIDMLNAIMLQDATATFLFWVLGGVFLIISSFVSDRDVFPPIGPLKPG